ncbi:TIGR03620 family F420-dependent LLM class oxidoreductase [Spirillospora sp. NPDC047279]|uniref:TIGR03620 family F420-dependent LLM class oxidoreductase n=1 Tax=Spirillospora sp. NPDC047279 TaxID=3155478 RepID=UPI0033F4959B
MQPSGKNVGIWTGALDTLALGEAREAVAELDEQGWASLWLPEAFGREALTAAQVYLSASSRMTVGTGIASIYARDALATATATRTLHAAYPGRFVLGLGVSHAPMVEGMRGQAYGKPVAAMTAYLDALDAAPMVVAGEKENAPRVLAALGPRMLELARDRAQGAHPYLVTPEHTATAREVLGAGPLLVVEQAAVVTPAADTDDEVFGAIAHGHLKLYSELPNYRASWLRQGFDESDLVSGGSPKLAGAMVARGLEATAERVRAHFDAGASTVCVQVLGADHRTAPREDWARLAEALL